MIPNPLLLQDGPASADGDESAGQRVALGSARSVLLTVLGTFVMPDPRPVWTSTLVAVLECMGIAEKSARQAIMRAADAGWILGRKDGRRTIWQLSPEMLAHMRASTERVRSMGFAPHSWDHRWLVLVLTLPESRRAIRPQLYRWLGWTGFGNPSAGVWITPHADRVEETRRVIRRFALEDTARAFVGPSVDLGASSDQQMVLQAWDLPKLTAHYDALQARFSRMRPQSDEAHFVAHVQLVHEIAQLPFIDPGLPLELLPGDWNGHHAAKRLEQWRERWVGPATAHWRQLADITPPR